MFPPWILSLSVQVHTGVRAFKEGPYVSHFVRPTGCSILAGCGCSISFTRAALYEVLDFMHTSFRPCDIKTYVDDILQIHTGEKEVVFHQALEQATALVGALQAEHFVVSAKSTIVSSPPSLLAGCRRRWPPWASFCKLPTPVAT